MDHYVLTLATSLAGGIIAGAYEWELHSAGGVCRSCVAALQSSRLGQGVLAWGSMRRSQPVILTGMLRPTAPPQAQPASCSPPALCRDSGCGCYFSRPSG